MDIEPRLARAQFIEMLCAMSERGKAHLLSAEDELELSELWRVAMDRRCHDLAASIEAVYKERVATSIFKLPALTRNNPPTEEGKKEVLFFIDHTSFGEGYLAHSRQTARQWFEAFLDELGVDEIEVVRFKRRHMTQEEITALPEI